MASQVALVIKNPLAKAGDIRDLGSIPGLERSPGEGNGYLLQYSCLENPMDRGAWWATVLLSQRVGHNLVTNTFDQFLYSLVLDSGARIQILYHYV